jgi:predicted nucleic acid-binding protein
VILLDAFALVALLADEPAADQVDDLLRSPDVGIPATNLMEVVDHLLRRRGVEEAIIREAVDGLVGAGLVVLHTTCETPWNAARLRARHDDRAHSPLSLADCVLLATAGPSDSIATADGLVIAAARAEGIEVRALADSAGRTS